MQANKIKSKFGDCITFDVTTTYMEEESTANNVCQTKPNMKIIVILRNPVDRAYSNYFITKQNKKFEDIIIEEKEIEQKLLQILLKIKISFKNIWHKLKKKKIMFNNQLSNHDRHSQ
jgi:hypothetical protein